MTYQQQSKTVVYRSKMNPGPQEKLRHLSRLGLDCDSYHAYPQQGRAIDPLLRLLQQRIEAEKKKREARRENEIRLTPNELTSLSDLPNSTNSSECSADI